MTINNIIFTPGLLLSLLACGQSPYNIAPTTDKESGFLKMDTLSAIPSSITKVSGEVKTVFKVDFNGDGQSDYICQYVPYNKPDSIYLIEAWITADNKIYKTVPKYGMDYDYFWFVNIDEDKEPEIFSASGYEDGIDYAIYDQNLMTGKDKLLLLLNPILIENDRHYWGYPWDIHDIILKYDSGKIYLKASVDHDIERDGNITIPDSTLTFPAIFFHGHSTQPTIKVESIRNIKWTLLTDLLINNR